MPLANRKTYFLRLIWSGSFLAFILVVDAISIETQRRVMQGTMMSIAGGVTWIEYYPEWFFQALALLATAAVVILLLTVARLLGKPYPGLDQFASWKTSLISVSLLNVLFLGTSHVLSYPPFPLHQAYNTTLAYLCMLFGLQLQQFYDLASVFLITITVASVLLRYRGLGLGRRLLKVLQIVSLVMLPLGLEIFAFDNIEWNLHVAQFQDAYGIIPWFTNADLFFTSLFLFVLVTVFERAMPNFRVVWGQTKRRGARQG